MENLIAFVTVMLLFWIGYERCIEVIVRHFSGCPKDLDLVRDIEGFNKIEDAWRVLHEKSVQSIQNDSNLDNDQKNEKLGLLADKYISTNEAFDKKREKIISGRSLKEINFWYRAIYLIPLIIGAILGFLNYGIIYHISQDGFLPWNLVSHIVDVIITGLIFAGGPDLLHQVIALVEEQKEKIKRTP